MSRTTASRRPSPTNGRTFAMATYAGWPSSAAQCRALCSARVLVVCAAHDPSRPGSACRRRGRGDSRRRPPGLCRNTRRLGAHVGIGRIRGHWHPPPWPSGSGRRCCIGACVSCSITDYRVEQTTSPRWKLGTACLGLVGALLLSMVTLRPSVATAQDMKGPPKDDRPAGTATA